MTWDAIVIGSGFGAAMAAHALVHGGRRVLMLERGGTVGECTGERSVFCDDALFRFRHADFESNPHIVGTSGAAWPFNYDELEPSYVRVEQLLGVVAEHHADPTEPPHGASFPRALGALAPSSQTIVDAATRLGLHPSRIPRAQSFMIPSLMAAGMMLKVNTVCVRLLHRGTRVTGVAYVDSVTGARGTLESRTVILATGTLATPQLLLVSHLDRVNPATDAVGRYLTRQCNTAVFGMFTRPLDSARAFDTPVAIHDFVHGAADCDAPQGPLGGLQQLRVSSGLARAALPAILSGLASALLPRAVGLLAVAEVQPKLDNGVDINWRDCDQFGLPRLVVRHRYSARDRAANRFLVDKAKAILRDAGAFGTWGRPINTFWHAQGTVRMGVDERSAPLDRWGRYRGMDNLFVTDGSALPSSAGLNPNLTIAANALRIGAHIAANAFPAARTRGRHLPVHI